MLNQIYLISHGLVKLLYRTLRFLYISVMAALLMLSYRSGFKTCSEMYGKA